MKYKTSMYIMWALNIILVLALVFSVIELGQNQIKEKAYQELLLFSVELNGFCAEYTNITFEELNNAFIMDKAIQLTSKESGGQDGN